MATVGYNLTRIDRPLLPLPTALLLLPLLLVGADFSPMGTGPMSSREEVDRDA